MKLRQLILKNYRGFESERVFEFSDRFTVIAGINGRGKTAVLDASAFILYRFLKALDLASGGSRTIAADDVFTGADSAKVTMRANCGGIPVEFSATRNQRTKRVRPSGLTRAVKDNIVNIYGDPNRPDDQAPLAVYYTTDRAGFRLPNKLPTTIAEGQQLAYAGALVNRLVDYKDFMARWRVWIDRRDERVTSAFYRALQAFLEDFGDLEVSAKPPRLTIRKGAERFSISQFSDGERSFIAILADLVRRLSLANPELEDPLQGHGVVLIDELELHLHPRWQREIVRKLRGTFSNIQFIGTTHSPFLIQSLQPGELINLEPDEPSEYADRSIEDIAEHVMGVALPQKSRRYLEMMESAEIYFRLVRENAEPELVHAAEDRLNEQSIPFSSDPAFQALLKLERTALQGDENETG